MQLSITFKSPDAVYDQVQDYALDLLRKEQPELSEDDPQFEQALEDTMHDIFQKLSSFIEYREYIKIEFDLLKNTAKVVPV